MKKYFLTLLLITLFANSGCGNDKKVKKKKKNTIENVKKSWKETKTFDPSFYTNTNLSGKMKDLKNATTLEELIYLEDVEFDIIEENNRTIAIGKKLNINNAVTNEIFNFDDKNFMTKRGECRAKMQHLMDDFLDDGIINYSIKTDRCIKDIAKKFQKQNVKFEETSFNYLEDWHGDDFKDALEAFLNSCSDFAIDNNEFVKSGIINLGREQTWQPLCKIAVQYQKKGFHKAFFERYFSPFQVTDIGKPKDEGKFTGYYIWEINVSLKKTDKYFYPIYSMPPECLTKTTCYSRKEIQEGKLFGRGLEIAWTDSPMDLYFMQVQGSGIGILPDGNTVRINFSGKNNLQFKSFMEFFKTNPNFAPYKDYGSLSTWLDKNPDAAVQVINVCDSYVFFNLSSSQDVKGSQGVPLTQSRSIAIDPYYIPYGLPVWIETYLPIRDKNAPQHNKWLEFNRLWIAQDTGSAIKGLVRSDLFMGHGEKGEFIAKNMKFPGKMYFLLPNILIDQIGNE